MADDERDDWGFTDADHVELQALMTKHQERLPEAMLATMQHGVKPEPDDTGIMGLLGSLPPKANTRVFPKGGMWWALLDALRAIDDEKGGA